MKELNCIWLLLISQTILAQSSFSFEDPAMESYFADSSNVPIVRGKFLHYTLTDLDTLSIVYVLSSFSLDSKERRLAEVKKDGTFELKIDHPLPYQEVSLGLSYGASNIASIRFYAHKGLFIEVDLQRWRELGKMPFEPDENTQYKNDYFHLSGPDAAMNRILKLYDNFDLARRQEAYQLESAVVDKNLSLADRLSKLNQAQKIFTDQETQFFQGKDNTYRWIITEERLGRYYGYFMGAHFYNQKSKQMLPQEVFNYQPNLLNSSNLSYYTYLGYFLIHYNGDLYRGLDSAALSPQKKDLIKIMGGFEELELRIQHVEKVLPTMYTAWCRQLLTEALHSKIEQTQKINQTLEKTTLSTEKKGLGKSIGSLPQGAHLYHAEEINVDSLIKRIRSQYPNQALIFDVWATWCSPCVEDMKNSKNNKEKLKEASIQVVYLCVNASSTEEKWRKKIAEIGVEGEHLWLNNELSSNILSHFQLSGYPSYIVIDAQGKYHPHLVPNIQFLDVEALKKKL